MEKLLFTGGTGFLGTNVKPILEKTFNVTTIGITNRDMIKANLVAGVPDLPEHYDVVLHAAGKAHVYPKTDAEIKEFYDVNYVGTVNLCTALEKAGLPKSFIFISTLDVYGIAVGEGIDETSPKNPTTHYAISKLQAEEYLIKWAEDKGVILGILRPSLMVGPNPPGNLQAMITGIKKGYYVNIAGGDTRKSLMMIQDIAHLVLKIKDVGGIYNVCDNHHPSYKELSGCISKQLGKTHNSLSIPYWMAWCMAKVGDLIGVLPIDSHRLEQLTKSNTYSNEKAKKALNWEPMDVLENFKIR
jgi:nucleoside-diphosphate-sugar epimerase